MKDISSAIAKSKKLKNNLQRAPLGVPAIHFSYFYLFCTKFINKIYFFDFVLFIFYKKMQIYAYKYLKIFYEYSIIKIQ